MAGMEQKVGQGLANTGVLAIASYAPVIVWSSWCLVAPSLCQLVD